MGTPARPKLSNLPEIDLSGSLWSTFGHNDSGKSYLNRRLMKRAAQEGNTIVIFDPMEEYPSGDEIFRIVPNARRGQEAIEDLGDALDWVAANQEEVDYLLIDEANRFHSSGGDLDGPLGEVVDLRAHWDMGVGLVTRRPTQNHPDIRELADYTVLFRLQGRNDKQRLNRWIDGLGDDVAQLDEHHFIVVFPSLSYQEFPPI